MGFKVNYTIKPNDQYIVYKGKKYWLNRKMKTTHKATNPNEIVFITSFGDDKYDENFCYVHFIGKYNNRNVMNEGKGWSIPLTYLEEI